MKNPTISNPQAVRRLVNLFAGLALASGTVACTEHPRPRRQDPTVRNPPSVGFIDLPSPESSVGPAILIAGWAADESGIEWVRVFADDLIVGNIPLTVARPDVEKVFPQFARPGAVHGWQTAIDFGDRVGYCVIRAEALDGRGALTRFAHVTVKIQP